MRIDQMIRCTCSDRQLEQVGCNCDAENIITMLHIWPKGYAHEDGPKYLKDRFRTSDDIRKIVREKFGNWAEIFNVSQRNFTEKPVKMTPEFEAYCRTMSKNDNS